MRRYLFLLLLALAGASGCSRHPAGPVADWGPPGSDSRALISVRNTSRGLLFSFFDQRAELRTVDRLEQVLPSARGEVLVTDPRAPLDGDDVYLADLRMPDRWGGYRVWTDRRGAWLDRVMPRLSQLPRPLVSTAEQPGAADPRLKKLTKKKRQKRPRPAAAAGAGAAAAARGAPPRVIVFSTSWCPSCKAACAHLTGKGIQFAEVDVERDQQAAAYYQKLIETHRLKPGAVPLIVVDGKPMQGFSAPQLDAVLAAAGLGGQGRR